MYFSNSLFFLILYFKKPGRFYFNFFFYKDLHTIYGLPQIQYESICSKLNEPSPGSDFTVTAHHFGYSNVQAQRIALSSNPTDALLFHWATKSGNDLSKLTEILKKMKRYDIVEILDRKGKSYMFRRRNDIT